MAREDDSTCRNRAASGIADAGQDLHEVDQLLNDPDVALDAHRVWSLLADMKRAPRKPKSARVSAPE